MTADETITARKDITVTTPTAAPASAAPAAAAPAPSPAAALRAATAPPRSRAGLRVGTATPADHRDNELTFAAGDLLVYVAQLHTPLPTDFSDLDGTLWKCPGWVDAAGYTFKFGDTVKEVPAAGSWFPIRTIIASRTARTFDTIFLEGINPVARALYDDVPIADLKPADTGTIASYIPSDRPWKNHYCVVFDGFDGDKKMRVACPDAFISTRGSDQVQQLDVDMLNVTWTLNAADIDGTVGAYRRIIDYSTVPDTSSYFTS
jgi:hypothetical protein